MKAFKKFFSDEENRILLITMVVALMVPVSLLIGLISYFRVPQAAISIPRELPELATSAITATIEMQEDALEMPNHTPGLFVQSAGSLVPARTFPTVAGSKAVLVVYLNCTGANCSEHWDNSRKATSYGKVGQGVSWWRDRVRPLTQVNYDFVIEQKTVNISREPINIPSAQDSLWLNESTSIIMSEILQQEGVSVDISGLEWGDKARFIEDRIAKKYGAQHGFIVFMVDSLNDPDGAFAANPDGFKRTAYSYLGNITVIPYDSGSWGIDNMHLVGSHEFGHMFFGLLDQYAPIPCSAKGGYLKYSTIWPEITTNRDSQTGGTGCNVPATHGVMDMGPNYFELGLVSPSSWCQAGWCDLGKWIDGQFVKIPDGYPDLVFPVLSWIDQGDQLENIHAELRLHPVAGTTPSVWTLTSLYVKTGGSIINTLGTISSQGESTSISVGSVVIPASEPSVSVCIRIAGMPDYCKPVRQQLTQIFLPLICKDSCNQAVTTGQQATEMKVTITPTPTPVVTLRPTQATVSSTTTPEPSSTPTSTPTPMSTPEPAVANPTPTTGLTKDEVVSAPACTKFVVSDDQGRTVELDKDGFLRTYDPNRCEGTWQVLESEGCPDCKCGINPLLITEPCPIPGDPGRVCERGVRPLKPYYGGPMCTKEGCTNCRRVKVFFDSSGPNQCPQSIIEVSKSE